MAKSAVRWLLLLGSAFLLSSSAVAPVNGIAMPSSAKNLAVMGAISGTVIDGATHRPIRGAAVTLQDSRVKVSVGTITDSKGRFVLVDLPASDGYELQAVVAG